MSDEPPCDRFTRDGAGALAVERGTLEAAHLASCAVCREAHAAYLAFAEVVREARAEPRPADGWEDDVRRRIAVRRRARGRARSWRYVAGGAAALAAVALVIIILGRRPGPRAPAHVALATSVVSGGAVKRADVARPGDTLRLVAHLGGGPAGELRVYRVNGKLILRCAPAAAASPPGCVRSGDELTAEVTLPTAGRYRAVLVIGAWPASAATVASFDRDVAAAQAAGLRVLLDDPIDVR